MSHRDSLPKPNASERTKYRWRIRHGTETAQDTKRLGIVEAIKAKPHLFQNGADGA